MGEGAEFLWSTCCVVGTSLIVCACPLAQSSLLYMCGLCYQWLKSDLSVGSQPGQLRTGELMLLRVGPPTVHYSGGDTCLARCVNLWASATLVAQLVEHQP